MLIITFQHILFLIFKKRKVQKFDKKDEKNARKFLKNKFDIKILFEWTGVVEWGWGGG